MSIQPFSTIEELSAGLAKKEFSALELTDFYLKRIEKLDAKILSYLLVAGDHARAMAKQADTRLQKKDRLTPLTGIPMGLKDIFVSKGLPTTAASKILKNYMSPYNATVVEKLIDAGAVFLGKLNMDEFAMGRPTENSAYQVTRNPWDVERIPGGSSGGTAAAVAAGLSAGSLGTDTGGSIRQPAHLCNLVGLKPTYGRVSRYGLIAFASSLDQIGPMTRTVRDSAILLQTIAGHDPKDSTSAPKPVPNYLEKLTQGAGGVKGLTLGIPREYVKPKQGTIDPDILTCFESAVKTFQKLGAKICEVDLPNSSYVISTYYILAPAEASSNLARFDGVRYGFRDPEAKSLEDLYNRSRGRGFGPEVRRRILLGTYVLSAGYYDAYYLKAQKVRRLIADDFAKAFQTCDALISPVSPAVAFKLGEKVKNPAQMYLSDIFTIAVNLAGITAMSIPAGFSANKLPVGLQIMGKHFAEEDVLKIAHAFESACPFWKEVPKI